MTRKIVRSILFSATLLVSLAAVATAQDNGICSTAGLAGEWGYTSTGAFIFPTGAVPFALVGRLTFDAAGNFSGAQNSSMGGQVGQETIKGTTTVNPDCTGTQNVKVYNQSGTLLSTSVLAFVMVDNGREVGGIFTSQALANGTNGPTVATFNAKRQFPRSGQ
jgi:hypothetical protein